MPSCENIECRTLDCAVDYIDCQWNNALTTSWKFWLTRRGRVEVHRIWHRFLISDYAPSRSVRSSDKQLLSRPYTSLVMADEAFSVSATKIWNYLPLNRSAATWVNSFKRNIKRELFLPRVCWSLPLTVVSRASDSVFLLGLIGALWICFVFAFVVESSMLENIH